MPTVLDAARMANAVYQDAPVVPGWSCIKPMRGGILNGFQAATFVKDGVTILAFRGTNYSGTGLVGDLKGGLASDVGADFKLWSGMNSSYFADGDSYAFAYQHLPNVYVCGHSLGGAIAQVVANRNGFKFVTFNAPGVAVVASRNLRGAPTLTKMAIPLRAAGMVASAVRHPVQAAKDMAAAFHKVDGLNICLDNDRVSKLGVHYGRVLRIPGTSADWKEEHKMTTVLSVLEGKRRGDVGDRDLAHFELVKVS